MTNKNELIIEMAPFLRNDQYNFIKFQLNHLVHAQTTVRDEDILSALKLNAYDKMVALFPELKDSQKALLQKLIEFENVEQVERLVSELKGYVIPFKYVSEKTVAKLFPKAKKLKMPVLEDIDFRELSYLGWYDVRSERKFLIFNDDNNLIGILGTFKGEMRGICSLCNRHEDVGLFMATVKSGMETYTSRGNYICHDSFTCNQNVITLERLTNFVKLVKE
ncbi:FusB/FusC family EF-G-binding protein [Alkalihalobacillus sp. LMS39]|uniref:FusB/FusC family EF-G-binding protein n=1 Tax=Alkalihalobacillus sp. LMS39 TaxID=2924032 RepID=UPI001FB47463|nr:FusB/FusC family EF-G-binding protein [Alkalihalobacillus sp. LMS39]UOE94733.1 FusB/FusC family EF-G-binding protein [Alkalihalobacillus sp. LMS39]